MGERLLLMDLKPERDFRRRRWLAASLVVTLFLALFVMSGKPQAPTTVAEDSALTLEEKMVLVNVSDQIETLHPELHGAVVRLRNRLADPEFNVTFASQLGDREQLVFNERELLVPSRFFSWDSLAQEQAMLTTLRPSFSQSPEISRRAQ